MKNVEPLTIVNERNDDLRFVFLEFRTFFCTKRYSNGVQVVIEVVFKIWVFRLVFHFSFMRYSKNVDSVHFFCRKETNQRKPPKTMLLRTLTKGKLA